MKRNFLFSLLLLCAISLSAQENNRSGERPEKLGPEELALLQTNRLNESLGLDSVQFQAIFIMNYSDALAMEEQMKSMSKEKRKEMRKNPPSAEERKAFCEEREQRKAQREAQLKKILTPEQYEKYLSLENQKNNKPKGNRQKRMGRMGNDND